MSHEVPPLGPAHQELFSSANAHTHALPPASTWERLSNWVVEHKFVVYSIAGVVVVASGVGVFYAYSDSRSGDSADQDNKKPSKKERRQAKKDQKQAATSEKATSVSSVGGSATVEDDPLDGLPDISEAAVESLSQTDRQKFAEKLKKGGNKAYGAKDYNRAIELYGKAILCKPDPIFYSNRAACFNALGDWEKVIEDTTAAININQEYVKALNRRANAYEHLKMYSEALLDYTASCIIDQFQNDQSAQGVERMLQLVAEAKAKQLMSKKPFKLPSPTFVTNYLNSFRSRPPPAGLEETADLDEQTGKGQLRFGLASIKKGTGESYEAAASAFDKAVELGGLGEHEGFAHNMRGTFRYLRGENDKALQDLSQSIDLQPGYTQSYIKRASMHLELGRKDEAASDFEEAMKHQSTDPDIYYHRAQLNFIVGQYAEAAKDYQKSIDLDRDFIFSHIQLGVTQYKMGSIASSMATFRRTIKNFDKVPDVYNYYGELLLDQQKYQDAIEKFDTSIEKEKQTKPLGMNVLPLINKALALFQWKQDFAEAQKLCEKALIIDPGCDIAVATMAQLFLQQGKVTEALKYFERAAELARTEPEAVSAISYAEATRTQLEVQQRYPQLQERLQSLGGGFGPAR